jgi:hypothetical protein
MDMGDWAIVIEGTGPHHNEDYASDADVMTRSFVRALQTSGHTVKRASFTHGGTELVVGVDVVGDAYDYSRYMSYLADCIKVNEVPMTIGEFEKQ